MALSLTIVWAPVLPAKGLAKIRIMRTPSEATFSASWPQPFPSRRLLQRFLSIQRPKGGATNISSEHFDWARMVTTSQTRMLKKIANLLKASMFVVYLLAFF